MRYLALAKVQRLGLVKILEKSMEIKETKQESAIVLRKAAAVMLKGGLIAGSRGNILSEFHAHCALGAIDTVRYQQQQCPYDSMDLAKQALADMIWGTLEQTIDKYNGNQVVNKNSSVDTRIAAWSNMLCKTAEQVACVMNATAELLEEQAKEIDDGTTEGR